MGGGGGGGCVHVMTNLSSECCSMVVGMNGKDYLDGVDLGVTHQDFTIRIHQGYGNRDSLKQDTPSQLQGSKHSQGAHRGQ